MRGAWCLALLLAVIAVSARAQSAATQIAAVQGLISRLIPQWQSGIQLNITTSPSGDDFFTLQNSATGISIIGNSGVSLATGLNWYLKYYANCSVSWGWDGSGNQLNLPPIMPQLPSGGLTMTTSNKYRYYMNVCTVSYSMAWWNIERWQQEVDWMALNGINLPLAFTGQEYVWHKVWSYFGLSEDEMDFTGPAFLAWGRMGNIRNWANPLPKDWRDGQRDLGRQILAMTRAYGMTNVLPCFGGHVPAALQNLFPSANITWAPNWGNFNSTYNALLLDPTDPLFYTIGKRFIQEIMSEFGTDHIYNCDTFNEMDPPTNATSYLVAASKAVIAPIRAADPQGIWLMQGWLFQSSFWTVPAAQAYLSGVPNSQMIILDLWAEQYPIWSQFNSYFGKPFIWCMLHNFGGNRAIYGNLSELATGPIAARMTKGSTMIGTGLTMEAIEHNPVVYELMNEMGWRTTSPSLPDWLNAYAVRRYGGQSPSASAAWQILLNSHYSTFEYSYSLFQYPPAPSNSEAIAQNVSALPAVVQLMVKAADELEIPSQPFMYDLVDLTRQLLANTFNDLYMLSANATADLRNQSLIPLSTAALGLLKDLDALLATDENYLLGQWIERARSWATESTAEADQFEFNARNQLTLWGPDGQINDYAAKQWAGLVGDYYYMRWSMYFQALLDASAHGEQFNNSGFQAELLAAEQAWGLEVKSFPIVAQGSPLEAAVQVLAEYVAPLSNYNALANMDVPNVDLAHAMTQNIETLAWLCNQEPRCLGFNSNGYLKYSSTLPISSPNCTLYVKV